MKSLPQKLWFALITWPENLMAARRSNCLSPSMTPTYRPLCHGSKETQMFRYIYNNSTFLTDRCSQQIIFWVWAWAQLKSWYIYLNPSQAYLGNSTSFRARAEHISDIQPAFEPQPSLALILNSFLSRAERAKLGLFRLKPARALMSFL